MNKIPNRAKSGFKFALILIMYAVTLTMVFISWIDSGVGAISIGLAIGSLIGIGREANFRLKYKKMIKQ